MNWSPRPLLAVVLAALLATTVLPGATAVKQTPASDWIDARYVFSVGADVETVHLTGALELHKVEAPPDLQSICGASCTADELRQTYSFASTEQRQALVAAIEDAVEAHARTSLARLAGPGNVTVEATADRSALAGPAEGEPTLPPIPVDVTGRAGLGLVAGSGLTTEQVGTVLEMGARARLPVQERVAAGHNVSLTLTVPVPLALFDATGGTLSSDGRSVTWTVSNWEGTGQRVIQEEVLVGRDDVVVPEAAEGEVSVTLDLSSVGVQWGNLIGDGSPAAMDLALSIEGTFRSLALDQAVPAPLELPVLSADAVRLALDAGLVDRSQVTGFETDARTAVRQLFQEGFGTKGAVHGGFSNQTLAIGQVGDPPGTGGPLQLRMNASGTLGLPPEAPAGDGLQAFQVASVPIGEVPLPTLPLPGDTPVTYTIILPPGVDLSYESVENAEITKTVDDQGRTVLTLDHASGEGPATIQGSQMIVNHPFVLDLFWPLLLVLFLLLVVFPGLLIAYVVRRRRKRATPARASPAPERSAVSGGGYRPPGEGLSDDGPAGGRGASDQGKP